MNGSTINIFFYVVKLTSKTANNNYFAVGNIKPPSQGV